VKIPKNLTIYEGGRVHKGEVPENVAGKIKSFPEIVKKAQEKLDSQVKKSKPEIVDKPQTPIKTLEGEATRETDKKQ
jgi:hypothetical protein